MPIVSANMALTMVVSTGLSSISNSRRPSPSKDAAVGEPFVALVMAP